MIIIIGLVVLITALVAGVAASCPIAAAGIRSPTT
jgi:hypothetical protein